MLSFKVHILLFLFNLLLTFVYGQIEQSAILLSLPTSINIPTLSYFTCVSISLPLMVKHAENILLHSHIFIGFFNVLYLLRKKKKKIEFIFNHLILFLFTKLNRPIYIRKTIKLDSIRVSFDCEMRYKASLVEQLTFYAIFI
jgi:hypothetical protein